MTTSTPSIAILVYEVAGRRFGVPAAAVQEVVRAVAVTPLPEAPDVIEGMIDLRGEVVPVVDLRARLGLPRRALSASDQFLVTRSGDRTLALRVDRALDLVDVPAESLAAPERAFADDGTHFGYAKLADGLVPILEPAESLRAGDAARLGMLVPLRLQAPR